MGGRPVTVAPSGARAPSIRDSREAGRVAGALETQPGIRSRRATAGTSSSAVGFHGAGAGPHRPARTREAPGSEPGSAPDTGVPENLAKRVKPDRVPGFTALPWLSAQQNEDRGELYRRVAEWGDTPHDSSQPEAEAYEALGRVSRMERDLMRADELLQGMRTRLLSEAEWGELRFLVEQARANAPHRMGRAMNMLDGLEQSGGLNSAEAGLPQNCPGKASSSAWKFRCGRAWRRLPWWKAGSYPARRSGVALSAVTPGSQTPHWSRRFCPGTFPISH